MKAGESTERQTKRGRQTDSEGGREHRERDRQREGDRRTVKAEERERKKEEFKNV